MNKIRNTALVAIAFLFLVSCFKEKSLELSGATLGSGGSGGSGGGGSTPVNTYGFSLKDGAGTEHKGCVDTASYDVVAGVSAIGISLTDADNNNYVITLIKLGNITTGTYTTATSSATSDLKIYVDDSNGDTFMPGSVTLKITALSSTEITAEFSGTLTATSGSATYTITNGTVKAKLGAVTPC